MNPKFLFTVTLFVIVFILTFCNLVESSPHSPNAANVKSTINYKEPSKKTKNVTNRESESEVEEIEPVGETGPEFPPPKRRLPYFPSFSLPHDQFVAELEKIMEDINAGLEKVVQSIHDVVHEGLNVLGGLDHDKAFITGYDPNLFKDKIAKYDEEQAARRRQKQKNATNS